MSDEQKQPVPGYRDLLVGPRSFHSKEDLARIEGGCVNVIQTLHWGIAGTASILFHAVTHGDEPVDQGDIASVACLIEILVRMLEDLTDLRADALYAAEHGPAAETQS